MFSDTRLHHFVIDSVIKTNKKTISTGVHSREKALKCVNGFVITDKVRSGAERRAPDRTQPWGSYSRLCWGEIGW